MKDLPEIYAGALCLERAPDDPRWSDPGNIEREKIALARELWNEICSDCPVRVLCLRHAVTYSERGIWAGTTDLQRKRMRRVTLTR